MKFTNKNSLSTKKYLQVGVTEYAYFDLNVAANKLGFDLESLPCSMKVLLENLLRFEDGVSVTGRDLEAVANWVKYRSSQQEIAFRPARVLMQDFTGVPAVVDLAAMRDATIALNGDPNLINPIIPVDLVVDHSVQVDSYAEMSSLEKNVNLEMERNLERYQFLRWGQTALKNFRLVPPGTGICHQVNLEYLAKVIWNSECDGEVYAYPDTVLGTDSHTTMVNSLAVLGWGVGGIEAEAAMLGQPVSMLLPEIIGFKITGSLPEGATATDLVLTITQMLRKKGVVGKFVEFYGDGLTSLALADRATISNMAPEYGATCGFFPIDQETIKYLQLSSREPETIALVEAYAKKQGLWRDDNKTMVFSDTLELNLALVSPSMAGPKRPQDRVPLNMVADNFNSELAGLNKNSSNIDKTFAVNEEYGLSNGSVVIAAITSCTNTSNPFVMIGAGLLARKARALGLTKKPWVKTSLAPGSKIATEYYKKSGLQEDLDALGFNLVGYGCTTCIGNSGPLLPEIDTVIKQNDLVVAAVLSGNRNFEGRVHPAVRANYLASPPLCVVYAIAGTINIDLSVDPIGADCNGNLIYLRDIWPSSSEINEVISKCISPEMFASKYSEVFKGDKQWQEISIAQGVVYDWKAASTYIKNPPYFNSISHLVPGISDINSARVLAIFGDSITTDHISPAGNIAKGSAAADYLIKHEVQPKDFNSYGARRGNHEVMMRGTFANTRIKNEMMLGVEGGYTKYMNEPTQLSIYDAAMRYQENKVPLVIIAGKEYGTGSSRDWAAKGTNLLGVKAVIAESFERIHRSNLVGMGVVPLQFIAGMTRNDLSLSGDEEISIEGLSSLEPGKNIVCVIKRNNEVLKKFELKCRIDTEVEVEYVKHGGILHYMLRNLVK